MAIVKTDIKSILEDSKRQLAELVHQRDQINVAIIQLQNQVQSLSAVALREELTQRQRALVGISEAIRSVLRLKNKAMTAAEVKADLEMMGYDFRGFKNPSAMVHNTLKRMAETGEVLRDFENKTFQLHSTFWGR